MIPATLNCMKRHPDFKMPFYTSVTWLGAQQFVRTNAGIIQRHKNVTRSQYLVFYKTSILEGPELPCRFQHCNPLLVLLTFPATPESLHDTKTKLEKVCCYSSHDKPIVFNSKCMSLKLVTNVKVAMVFAVIPKVLKK
jgi:hypothetical protein